MRPQEICIDYLTKDFHIHSELASSFGSLPSTYSPSSLYSEFSFGGGMEGEEAGMALEFGLYNDMDASNATGFEMTQMNMPGTSAPKELFNSEYLNSHMSSSFQPVYSPLTNCLSPPLLLADRVGHAEPQTFSTSSGDVSSKCNEGGPAKRMKCSICGQTADGFHFNALSCAACGAFFRRSIADQKTYSCPTKDCDILQPRKHGTTCRYCRFQACILSGMLPNEVQCKRQKMQKQSSCSTPSSNSSSSSSSSSFFPTLSQPTNKPTASSPEYKPDQLGTTKRRKLQGAPVPQGQTTTKPKNPVDQETSILEAICSARRKIVGMRGNTTKHLQQHMFSTNYINSKQFFEEEMHWFQTVVLQDPLIQQIIADNCSLNESDEAERISNWNFGFWIWCLLECALATLRYGGVQTGRLYFPDQGFLELQHENFVEFFAAKFPRDASFLARLSLPIAEFFVENLCRSLQAERLGGEYECAALLALVLSGVISEQGNPQSLNYATSSAKNMGVKRQVFSELLDHCATVSSTSNTCSSPTNSCNAPMFFNEDSQMPANKMGIVLLASSSLIEAVNMLKELYCCFKIVEDLCPSPKNQKSENR